MTNGHDHDELQLGHRSGLHAFASAVVRNPEGDTSATTVRRRWAAGQNERAATRRQDIAREKAAQWWNMTSRQLPKPAQVATAGQAETVVAVLAGLPAGSWRSAVATTVRATDWHAPDAGDHFARQLSRVAAPTRTDPTSATPTASRSHTQ